MNHEKSWAEVIINLQGINETLNCIESVMDVMQTYIQSLDPYRTTASYYQDVKQSLIAERQWLKLCQAVAFSKDCELFVGTLKNYVKARDGRAGKVDLYTVVTAPYVM